jgi:hypothetical protein
MTMLFKKTKMLEQKMDVFLDVTSESALVFADGLKAYFEDDTEVFDTYLEKINVLENRADDLRREIESHLYTETLIPESRGDVLALLETTDDVTNQVKETMLDFSIETPAIPADLQPDFIYLAQHSSRAMDEVVKAIRHFLRNPLAVADYLHKVYYYEKEADQVAERLKRKVFGYENLDLSTKFHLRFFIRNIDSVADKAEDVADRLTIYTIKRSV